VSKPLLCRGLILILILSYHVFEILKLRNHQFWFSEQKCKIKEPLVHALAKLKEVPEPQIHERSVKEPFWFMLLQNSKKCLSSIS
jgi:hypothetical protein